jgi:hypothetical protein
MASVLRHAASLALLSLLAPWPVLAQNLIQNGGFISSLGGWQQHGSVTATWDSSDAAGSATSGSAKLMAPANSSQGGLQQSFPVTPGYSYEFSASSRGVPFAGSMTFGFQHPYRFTYSVVNNLWRSDSVVLHAVPNASTGSIELSMNNAPAGVSAFFDQVSVVQLPTAIRSFSASSPSIAQGQCASLMIAASSATSLSIDQGVGALQESFNAQWLVPNRCPTTTTTYTLTVSGPTGTVTRQATITVVPPPTATFSAIPASISEGEAATLSWTTTNATSISIDNGVGTVSASGTTSVSPSTTTTYTLTASGIGGTTTKQVSVTVTPPKPQISFNATPRTIAEGESTTLSWSVLNATGVSIDHGIGTRPASASVSVSPTATTTYRLTATGPGGSSTAQVTITVLHAPVIIFVATPSTITRGSASTLTWIVTEATSVVIDNSVGPQPPNGALEIRPTDTTTYLLTATGPGGVRQAQVTITVQVSGRRRAVRH